MSEAQTVLLGFIAGAIILLGLPSRCGATGSGTDG
jgi:hypothetical protein